jgi:hypothetical protein
MVCVMPESDEMMRVAAPEAPQIGSCATAPPASLLVTAALPPLLPPPQPGKTDSIVAPADAPANIMNVRREGDASSAAATPDVADVRGAFSLHRVSCFAI